MERGTTPTVAGVAVGDRNDSVGESDANQKPSTQPASRSSSATRHTLPLPIDAHDEPVAAALDHANGARELVGLFFLEPDAVSFRAVNVLVVVARGHGERAHVCLHLLARSFLLWIFRATADGEERERRQRGGATTSRQRARRRTARSAGDSSAAGSSATASARRLPRQRAPSRRPLPQRLLPRPAPRRPRAPLPRPPPPRRRQSQRPRPRPGQRAPLPPPPGSRPPRPWPPPPGRASGELADARLLADLLAEVVQLGPVDVADRGDLDLLDLRRVHRERPLDADAERLLAHRERLARAGALPLDHDPLEDLDAPALTLDHLEVDAQRVARLEAWDVLAQLSLLDALDDRAHGEKERPRSADSARRCVAETPRLSGRASAEPGSAECAWCQRTLCGSAASRWRRPSRSGSCAAPCPTPASHMTDERLSPIMKYCPWGTLKLSGPPASRRLRPMYGSSSFLPSMKT